jgi:type I restriction enzyme S subunit
MNSVQSSVTSAKLGGKRPLPEGWVWTTLGESCDIVLGQSPSSDTYNADGIGLPFYQGKAEFGDLYPTPEKWCSSPKKIAEENDILITVRAPVGPTNLCPEKSCIGRGLAAIRPRNGMPNKFFLYYLRYIEKEWDSKATGTTFKAITGDVLRNQEMPLPPLAEQERIVARLEELLSDLEAGVAALERVRAGVKRYKASVLKAACEGKLFGDRGIEDGELLEEGRWVTVGDVTESMKNGVYKPAEYYADDGIACLRMYNIEDGAIVWKDIKRMKLTEEEVETYRLLPGDILVNRVNSRELVGKTAVIPSGLESIVYESKNIRLKIKQDIADSTYINYCFGAYRQRYFNFNAQQVVGMASINQTQIAQMPIPLPPLEEQLRIVVEVERRLESARAVESAVEVGLKRAGRLRQAVLRSAFEGRL